MLLKKKKITLVKEVKRKQEESLALINKMEGLRGREIRFMDILDIDDKGIQIIKDTSRSGRISRATTPDKVRRDSSDSLDQNLSLKIESIPKPPRLKEDDKVETDAKKSSEEANKKEDRSPIMIKIANAKKMLHKVASKFKESIAKKPEDDAALSEKLEPSELTSVDSRRSKPDKTFKSMLKDFVEEGSSSRRRRAANSLDSRSKESLSKTSEP